MSTPNSQHSPLTSVPDSLVTFDGLRLDSILTVVGSHYGKTVAFRDTVVGALRMSTEWNRNQPLSEFIGIMNEFDGLLLREERDTLFVESVEEKSEQ